MLTGGPKDLPCFYSFRQIMLACPIDVMSVFAGNGLSDPADGDPECYMRPELHIVLTGAGLRLKLNA
ncbi:hypothetical protein PSSHI_42880 [Photobacterium sp. R1]